MVQIIPDKVKKLWDSWDLRVFILASLSLQAFLILFATSRKRSSRIWIIISIWSAYLLADWVAAVTLGLISGSQGDASGVDNNGDLVAIWAPFLLLHLGGPDTITSFSMEDNELWLRHLFALMAQVLGAIYVFIQTLPGNKLWAPTILVFTAGTIRYAERTRALYLASLDHFGESAFRQPNPGPEYERIQRMYSSLKSANVPTHVKTVKGFGDKFQDIKYRKEEDLDSLEPWSLFVYAYDFFETFKCLIVGLLLSSQDGQVSRDFFLNRKADDAIKITEIELSLLYEVLHTKATVVQCRNGYIFRSINFCSIIVALLLFYLVDKQRFRKFDVLLTYALFAGAVVLDIISVCKLLLFDWTIVKLENRWVKHIASRTIRRRRWSNSVSQLNMISYCLSHPPRWIYKTAEYIRCENLFDQLWTIKMLKAEKLCEGLSRFIFMELRMKSLKAKDMKEAMAFASKRGDWVLEHRTTSISQSLVWSVEVEYVESLLLWHIATELCWHHDETQKDSNPCDNEDPDPSKDEKPDYKKFGKHLSNYAFYLLLMQPIMMATVSGNWQMVFQDTLAEARRYFSRIPNPEHSDVCDKILQEPIGINPAAVKGDSKSIFFNACKLAQQLLELQKEDRWKLISQVWVEILCYAAVNCRANVHAQQPSKGGELLTLIWLLMHHFCLATQFYESSTARIKFILSK